MSSGTPPDGFRAAQRSTPRRGRGDTECRLGAQARTPVLGEWFALPLVSLAGSQRVGDEAFNEVFHPIAERLLAHCDAVLRVGGPSQGADLMVRLARERGLDVYHHLREIVGCESFSEPRAHE